MSTDEILSEVLCLPWQARALLAEKLLESLDFEEEVELSQEWKDEIRRRCHQLDDGVTKLLSAEEVFDEATRAISRLTGDGFALPHRQF